MKKFLALIVACVTVASSVAATVYSSSEFMTAAPVMLKGTLNANTWMADEEACALDKGKVSYPVYMSFCQPCIGCVECAAPISLSNVALYIVDKNTQAKTVDITAVKYEMDLTAMVTAGKAGLSAKKGDVATGLFVPPQQEFGFISPIVLVGNWNQKTWFTGIDDDSDAKVAAIMGIIQKLDGCVDSNTYDYAWACGDISLRRDDSFTKSLMMAMTDNTSGKVANPFLNCGEEEIDLDTCEEVMEAVASEGDYVGYNMVEAYILKKSSPKNYGVDVHFADMTPPQP